MTLYIYDFLKVGLLQRTPNLLESISTQNPLFWVVPTVHTQRFQELCQKSSVEKMLCFLCCSRVVSDMAEVRFMWIFREVGRNFISIVAVFFSLFSDTEDKNRIGIWGDIIIIRYPIFTMHRLSLQPRLQMQRTCHSQADLHGNSDANVQLTSTWLQHHAIHVGVAVPALRCINSYNIVTCTSY